jgi:cytochrome c-type biogenesis protein CcmH
MTLWLIFGLLTAAAIFAVLWPLGRPARVRTDSDLSVYRAQLEEIEADSAAGRIAENEAAAARLEISRRLLAAADAAKRVAAPADSAQSANRQWRGAALVAVLFIPLCAGSLYLALGSPQESGQPIASRRAPETGQHAILDLVGRVESHLAQNPDDARGWQVIAPVYMQLGRYADAVKAQQSVIRILGANAEREANLGEALAAAADGVVTADAKAAFERAQALDDKDYKSRFYLGIAVEQGGKPADAAKIWRDMLAKASSGSPWVEILREAIARVEGTAPPGPTEKQLSSANELSPEQRNAMVDGMVSRLAERLKSDGSDVEGWLRLLRSYMVLGEREKARAAAADARRALTSEPDKLMRINELIKSLGLES